MVLCEARLNPAKTHTLFLTPPETHVRPTIKGDTVPPFCYRYKRLASDHCEARPNTGHLRGVFWHVLVSGGPASSQNCSHPGWPSANLKSAGSLSVQERPSCAHTSHVENHLVFRFAVSNSFPFRSFHINRSLVRYFALIDISSIILVTVNR